VSHCKFHISILPLVSSLTEILGIIFKPGFNILVLEI